MLFSATHDQAHVLMARFRDLLAANEALFAIDPGRAATTRTASSQSHVRLGSGAEFMTRAWRTSTRGLHPDLIVLDDVLNDTNAGSEEQRAKTWRYFIDTIVPMHAERLLIVGTSLHADDLFHRLAPREVRDEDGAWAQAPTLDVTWRRFPALLEDEGASLWPGRHPYEQLVRLREAEPGMFAREYQNDPRDYRASLFPRALTEAAIEAGGELVLVPSYRHRAGELVVLGADLALSGAVGADYTVIMVSAWDVATGTRRLLAAYRVRGMDIDQQVGLLRELCITYQVDAGVIEDNGFQRFVVQELRRYPETRHVVGHTTTRTGKADVAFGIPSIKFALRSKLWVIPSGDAGSRRFARVWQSELAAFGWRDGTLRGIGEHDDTVMATWFSELAVAHLRDLLAMQREEIVTMEDLGIKPVKIGDWDDESKFGW